MTTVPSAPAGICDPCLTLINDVRECDTDGDRAYRLSRTATEHSSFGRVLGAAAGGLKFMCWRYVDLADTALE